MKADLTLANLYWNKNLASFFFTKQGYKTFEDLVHQALAIIPNGTFDQKLDVLDQIAEEVYCGDLDAFTDDCHSLSVDELLDQLSL